MKCLIFKQIRTIQKIKKSGKKIKSDKGQSLIRPVKELSAAMKQEIESVEQKPERLSVGVWQRDEKMPEQQKPQQVTAKLPQLDNFITAWEQGEPEQAEALLADDKLQSALQSQFKENSLKQIKNIEERIEKRVKQAKEELDHVPAGTQHDDDKKLKQTALDKATCTAEEITDFSYVTQRAAAALFGLPDPTKGKVLELADPEKTAQDMALIVKGFTTSSRTREGLLHESKQARDGCVDNLDHGISVLSWVCDGVEAEKLGSAIDILNYVIEEHGRDTAIKIAALVNASIESDAESVSRSSAVKIEVGKALNLSGTNSTMAYPTVGKVNNYTVWGEIAKSLQKDGIGDIEEIRESAQSLVDAANPIQKIKFEAKEKAKKKEAERDGKEYKPAEFKPLEARFQTLTQYVAENAIFRAHVDTHYAGKFNENVTPALHATLEEIRKEPNEKMEQLLSEKPENDLDLPKWEKEVNALTDATNRKLDTARKDAVYLEAAQDFLTAKQLIEHRLRYKEQGKPVIPYEIELLGSSSHPSLEGKVKATQGDIAVLRILDGEGTGGAKFVSVKADLLIKANLEKGLNKDIENGGFKFEKQKTGITITATGNHQLTNAGTKAQSQQIEEKGKGKKIP